MTAEENRPGRWPHPSKEEYRRLVALARRRLVGHEHLAEDVVSQALIKWAFLSPADPNVARLEQVIKSEAYSMVRSTQRAQRREEGVHLDPTSARSAVGNGDYVLLRRTIAETVKRHGIVIGRADVELLELLFAGFTQEEAASAMGWPRHKVRRSRARWQRIVSLALAEPVTDGSPA